MARSISIFRRTVEGIAARQAGGSSRSPKVLSGQSISQHFTSELLSLPGQYTDPAQYLNPGDPNYGKFRFMWGYDVFGGINGGDQVPF